MKKASVVAVMICCSIAFLTSCAYLMKQDAQPWLDKQQGAAEIDISGKWEAGSAIGGGWGDCQFIQTGNKITGGIGPYNAFGVAAGKEIFLMLTSTAMPDRVYFTVVLEPKPDGSLQGLAVEDKIAGTKEGESGKKYPMILSRPQQESPQAPDSSAKPAPASL